MKIAQVSGAIREHHTCKTPVSTLPTSGWEISPTRELTTHQVSKLHLNSGPRCHIASLDFRNIGYCEGWSGLCDPDVLKTSHNKLATRAVLLLRNRDALAVQRRGAMHTNRVQNTRVPLKPVSAQPCCLEICKRSEVNLRGLFSDAASAF